MVCISLIPLSTMVGGWLGLWAADGKHTLLGFCSILQAPLRHQKYSFSGMSRDLELWCPICSFDGLNSWLSP